MVTEASHPSVDAVLKSLRESPAPVALKNLRKALGIHASALPEALESGAAYLWPKFRRADRYWYREPVEFVRERTLEVAADAAMSKNDLIGSVNRRAHNCGAKMAGDAVACLVKEGALKTARTVSLKALYYNAARPAGLVRTSLAVLTERLLKAHVSETEIRALLGQPQPAAVVVPAQAVPAQAAPTPPERILDAIRRLQSVPSAPVTVQSLRAALPELSKTDFDRMVLSLADQQRIYLTTHDHGWALPDPDREHLVWDGGQKLYVAVTLRG